MWLRFAENYDLNKLNEEVRLDDAMNDIAKALHTGETLDLADKGFKAIKVNSPIPSSFDDEEQIDIHKPRENWHQYEGIALDHYQGVAFASQTLLSQINKALPTLLYISNESNSSMFQPFIEKLKTLKTHIQDLDLKAQIQMSRHEDFDQTWDSKSNDIPVWSSQHPQHDAYNQALNQSIDQENAWSKEHMVQFWQLWKEAKAIMMDILPLMPYGPYRQAWQEFIPV